MRWNNARSMSSGLSIDDMKTWGLTGTHPDRHIAPEVAARAGGPQKGADCIGDWATPKDGTQRDKSLSTHIPTSSARKGYQPNASLKDQLNARIRYARLLQTAFALYEAKDAWTGRASRPLAFPRSCRGASGWGAISSCSTHTWVSQRFVVTSSPSHTLNVASRSDFAVM